MRIVKILNKWAKTGLSQTETFFYGTNFKKQHIYTLSILHFYSCTFEQQYLKCQKIDYREPGYDFHV